MKTYPSIPYYPKYMGESCIAFAKYDGSNIRFSWTKKRGWYKYGTRRHLFNSTHETYGVAIDIFEQTLAEPLERIFCDHKDYRGVSEVTVFAEFFGPSSFAGDHVAAEPKELILFDVNPLKKGWVSPRNFVKHFGHLQHTAEVLYEGILDEEFVQDVIEGRIPVQEGIVAKGGSGNSIWRCKIKTAAWIQLVKDKFKNDWQKYHDQ